MLDFCLQEAPSIVQKSGSVCASEFLSSHYLELFEVVYERESLLENDYRLNHVGKRASQKGRQYNAVKNAKQLQQILVRVVQQPEQLSV